MGVFFGRVNHKTVIGSLVSLNFFGDGVCLTFAYAKRQQNELETVYSTSDRADHILKMLF